MCYQIFVHHACGHDEIVAQACELAADIPLWVKHECPLYQAQGMQSTFLCGKGRYYCGKVEEDGKFLDGIHATYERTKAQLGHIHQKMQILKQKAAQFHRIAEEKKIPQAVRRQHRAFGIIANSWTALTNERDQAGADHQKTAHIINHAIEFFREHKELAQVSSTDRVAQPPLTLPHGFGSLPMEYQPFPVSPQPFGIPMAAPPVAMTQQAINVSQVPRISGPPHARAYLPPSGGSSIGFTPNPLNPEVYTNTLRATPQNDHAYANPLMRSGSAFKHAGAMTEMNRDPNIGKSRSHRPTLRRRKRATLPKDDSIDINTIRRSGRVRVKKVSYAESQASEASRSSSPDKYEGEESPEKSEGSQSPEPVSRRVKKPQAKPQRRVRGSSTIGRNNTLASRIGGWQRRTGNTGEDPFGKSSIVQDCVEAGEQAAQLHQNAQADSGTGKTSSKLGRTPQSQHSQAMVKGASALTTGQGTFGFDGGDAVGQSNLPGNAFLEDTSMPAIAAPNMFKAHAQQSTTGTVNPGAAAQSWVVQQAGQYPSPQLPQHNLNGLFCGTGGEFAAPVANASFATGVQDRSDGFEGYQGHFSQASDFQTPADSRTDSVMLAGDINKLPDIDSATYFDYDRMRESIGASHDLSPAKTSDDGVTSLEPKKRALPASSPVPSAKRMRLSMPSQLGSGSAGMAAKGYDSEEDADGETVSTMSSPTNTTMAKTKSGGDAGLFTDAENANTSTPAPAQLMVPTAIHFQDSYSPTLAENPAATADLSIIVPGDAEQSGNSSKMTGQALEGGFKGASMSGEGLDATLGPEIDWSAVVDGEWSMFPNE